MRIIEKYILRFIVLHFILLIISQWLLSYQSLAPYLNKIIYYEGVMKDQYTEIVETMNR
ncbi:YpfB family protein [Calidifontibacillus oryziterrae]|uniref:YpfB family protein n=1 Tax=Calidifontibacillus oryziterrae TaxID=1191699 RepID=UPI0002E5FDE2|nr:YpfB family protein [Calidifontibacillus oryziterrae]